MSERLLDIRDLSVRYSTGNWGLKDLSLHVDEGETVGLVGASGCGKSSAAWAILGLLPAGAVSSGSVRVRGQEVVGASERTISPLRGRVVSLVPQEPMAAMNPLRRIGRQMGDVGGGQQSAAVKEMLSRLGLPARVYDSYPHQVSGGQLQRALVGQALLCKPGLLIADEPAAALDRATRTGIIQLIRTWQKELGFGLLLITHERDMLQGADRVIELSESSIPESAGGQDNVAGRDWLLRVCDLRKSYGAHPVLDRVSLEVIAGERLVISGESGAGKSTFAKCVAGWEMADGGTVELRGGGRAQLIPQEPGESLNPFWPVWEVVAEGLRLRGASVAARKEQALTWMERVGLPRELALRKSGSCSGGEKARVAIARALAASVGDDGRPALLIFDESFSGLDLHLRGQILDLLKDLQRKWPVTYIVIAHDEWLARRFGSAHAVLVEGRLSA